MRPIRTVAGVELEFEVATRDEFVWQRIVGDVVRMRSLGMTLESIGKALGVDEKTVRNTLVHAGVAPSRRLSH